MYFGILFLNKKSVLQVGILYVISLYLDFVLENTFKILIESHASTTLHARNKKKLSLTRADYFQE